jgi:hypothetical protein
MDAKLYIEIASQFSRTFLRSIQKGSDEDLQERMLMKNRKKNSFVT